ncbi:hypothetical protein [Streptomyces narbonensis]
MDRIIELPRSDRWQSMARASIREDLFAAHSALTADVLTAANGSSSPEERFKAGQRRTRRSWAARRRPWRRSRARTPSTWRTCRCAMRTMRMLPRLHS